MGTILSIGIGEGPAEMHQALDLCREFNGRPNLPRLYASAGIYPHNTTEADNAALVKLDALLAEPEVIACGEIGLDYYHEGAPHEVQKQGLIRQLEIAAARNRPILIHCRPKDAGVPGGTGLRRWGGETDKLTPGMIFSRSLRNTGHELGSAASCIVLAQDGSRRGARLTWDSWSRLPAI